MQCAETWGEGRACLCHAISRRNWRCSWEVSKNSTYPWTFNVNWVRLAKGRSTFECNRLVSSSDCTSGHELYALPSNRTQPQALLQFLVFSTIYWSQKNSKEEEQKPGSKKWSLCKYWLNWEGQILVWFGKVDQEWLSCSKRSQTKLCPWSHVQMEPAEIFC